MLGIRLEPELEKRTGEAGQADWAQQELLRQACDPPIPRRPRRLSVRDRGARTQGAKDSAGRPGARAWPGRLNSSDRQRATPGASVSDGFEAIKFEHPKRATRRRIIPTRVKLAVWKRDGGKCVKCGASDELHFDHDLPWSKGGASITEENVQLLCARHNLEKHDRIV